MDSLFYMSGMSSDNVNVEGAGMDEPHPEQHSQTQQQQGHQFDTDIPLESLRSLYLPPVSPVNLGIGQLLRRGSTTITYKTVPLEFPPVTRLDPSNKKRILVTGVSVFLFFFLFFFVLTANVCQLTRLLHGGTLLI